jgi:hypothetical protein
MAWIASLDDSSEGKMHQTLNGPALTNSGMFSVQYSLITITSTSAWSLFSNQLASTACTNPLAVSGASTYLNMSSDPTGKWPQSTLFLPGFGSKPMQTAPMGALTAGTMIKVRSVATWTAGGTFLPHLYLRSPSTGAISYTLTPVTTYSPTASAVGSILEFYLTVISATQVSAYTWHSWGAPAGAGALGGPGVPTTTTVDMTQDYVLDASITMGTSGSYAQQSISVELLG